MKGQLEMLQEAKTEIENFGPNPALIGQGLEDSVGRAIALLQQAGMAELGPYLSAYKNWKIRVYRCIWNIITEHWKAERWIRVTDDQNVAQFFQINKLDTISMATLRSSTPLARWTLISSSMRARTDQHAGRCGDDAAEPWPAVCSSNSRKSRLS
jgi:hypothetical protein